MRDFNQNSTSESYPVPLQYSCMWSEIIQSYWKLCERHNKLITQRKEICNLAHPKCIKLKNPKKCSNPPRTSYKIEIVNNTDKMENTRTEQLALPQLRQLNQLKSHPSFSSFNDTRKSGVNRLMRKSLYSVYSRLHNIVPAKRLSQQKTWSLENESRFLRRLRVLAAPKTHVLEQPYIKIESYEGPKMHRIRKLSKPRVYKQNEPNEWVFTKALKNFKPTERLFQISKHKKYDQSSVYIDPFKIPANALSYKASRRIKTLAQPAKYRDQIDQPVKNPFQIQTRALKAVASKRIEELATPKDYTDIHNREDAYHVSRKALRAKTTDRLKVLAVPRKR